MDKNKMIHISQLEELPYVDTDKAYKLFHAEYESFPFKIIVLDDDPTGIQTVHGVCVYTDWELDTIRSGFAEENSLFFILTNSRSFSAAHTEEVHRTIASRIGAVSKEREVPFILISRGDSTLRGHYPLETETLKEELEQITNVTYDGEIICPFFLEGGRYTLNNIHYVKEENYLVPAGQTEFAKDKTFGFTQSDLGLFVEEKSHGHFLQKDCTYISLEELRSFRIEEITEKLLKVTNFGKVIINAVSYEDVQIFCTAFLRALKKGRHFLIRSAAAFPKVLGDIKDIPLLTKQDLVPSHCNTGGIVLIGSHVQKTTLQLNELMNSQKDLTFLEFDVNTYFTEQGLESEVLRIIQAIEELIVKGNTAVVYTSRKLLVPNTADKDLILKASVQISDAITSIIGRLTIKPKFIIAKGGITSSDVGTKALQVKKALVMGQIKKGIPVWMTGTESKFPNTPYIIFPGNVGEVITLREIVEELM